MDLDIRLKDVEASVDEYNIDLYDSNYINIPMKLAYFELVEYKQLILELNRERYACQTYEEKELFVQKYKKIYLSLKKKYNRILKNLCNGEVNILYSANLTDNEEYFYNVLDHFMKFDKDKPLKENLNNYMKERLERNIKETNQELFKLKHYPAEYINTFSTYIGSTVMKYRRDIITYKDLFITAMESNSFSTFYNEHTTDNTKNALLNILAYLNGHPSFYFTENYDFNRKLMELYDQFDLLDMLRLRKKNFFDNKCKEPIYLEHPVLKQKNGYNLVSFEDSQHESIFELYHASLKQFESLPRCVFLYRVFEYGVANHYQPLLRPTNHTPEDALNYYVNEIMDHRYVPLYYVDYGTYTNEKNEITRKRETKYVNFTNKLKKEVRKIRKEWLNHHYLKNKSIGNIIYVTGRNASAHGGGGSRNARYDYSNNYKHINDVNILLELIARYIIEKLNPHLEHMVERRTKYYANYNKKIFSGR